MGASQFVAEHANDIECDFRILSQYTEKHFRGYLHCLEVPVSDQFCDPRGIVKQTQFADELILSQGIGNYRAAVGLSNEIEFAKHNDIGEIGRVTTN